MDHMKRYQQWLSDPSIDEETKRLKNDFIKSWSLAQVVCVALLVWVVID